MSEFARVDVNLEHSTSRSDTTSTRASTSRSKRRRTKPMPNRDWTNSANDLSRSAAPLRLVTWDDQAVPSNEIQFGCQHHDDRGVLEIVPRIDGAPLTSLIDRFEVRAGMQPAGDVYGGLIPRFLRFDPMEDYFHGRSTDATGPKTPLLGCTCGDWGCWPLMARITVTDDLVIWDAFEQPHRPARDYTGFGPFQFDRHHYDDAVRELGTAVNSAGQERRG